MVHLIMSQTQTETTTGYVLWQGNSPATGDPIVAILTLRTSNRKTGKMAQLWILRSDIAPTLAIATGSDDAICGSCPLRGDGEGKARACYVVVSQAPMSVFKAYKRGRYPIATPVDIARTLRNRKVRLGAYGDPAMLPIDLVRTITSASIGSVGYTHQWRTINPEWSRYVMASADSVADRRAARALGYRSFIVVGKNVDITSIPNAVGCMAVRERNPLQCADCMACGGTRSGTITNAVDIVIQAHGNGARYITA
jgi:hypothetical protein